MIAKKGTQRVDFYKEVQLQQHPSFGAKLHKATPLEVSPLELA